MPEFYVIANDPTPDGFRDTLVHNVSGWRKLPGVLRALRFAKKNSMHVRVIVHLRGWTILVTQEEEENA